MAGISSLIAIGVSLASAALPAIGLVAVFGMLFLAVAPKLPTKISKPVANALFKKATGVLGGNLALVRDADGYYTLSKAEYDAENNGFWVAGEFYDAEGVGGAPGGFYGSSLVVAYQGLGAVADLVSAELGRQATVKRQDSDHEGKLSGSLGKLLGKNAPKAVADGGEMIKDAEWKAVLPERKVVDLRNVLSLAPFNVRPEAFDRVEENAKAGQAGFAALGPMGQAGLLLGAAMLGGILVYLGMSSGGGGGVDVGLPAQIVAPMVMG